MNKKNKISKLALILLFAIILFISFASAYVSSRPQYTQSGFGFSSGIFGSGNPPVFDQKMCEAGQDFVLQVAPTGCSPAVVRSDLLEEQDTWVFCPIAATKINPLIKIEAIDRLIFNQEEFSEYVSDIGFHPVRSALGVQDKVTSPVLENIGYAVVKLKRIPTEAEMPDFVEGNITAKMRYDIENAFGTFRTGFYLKPMEDSEWNNEFLRYGFWRGKGYIRAEDVQSDRATISVYSGNTISRSSGSYQQKLGTFSLKKGEESSQVYLPTFDYCLGGLKVRLDDLKDPDTTARLKVNADDVEVVRGERFLDDKCVVQEIEKIGLNQKVIISCEEDLEGGFLGFGKSNLYTLEVKPKIELKVGDKLGNYSIGEWVFDTKDKSVFLSYAYTKKDSPFKEDLKVVFTALPKEDIGTRKQLTTDELKSFKGFIERYRDDEPDSGAGDFWKNSWDGAEGIGFLFEISSRWAISGESFDILEYKQANDLPQELGISKDETKLVTVLGLASPSDSEAMKNNADYKSAVEDFDILYSDFPSIKEYELKETPAYGQRAFEEKIKLARDTGQKKTMFELCEQFKEKYPNSNIDEVCFNEFEFASQDISSADVLINNKVKEISLKSIYEPTFDEYGAEILVRFPNGDIKKIPLQKKDIVYLKKSISKESLLTSETERIFEDADVKVKEDVLFLSVLKKSTADEIIRLKGDCNCDVVVTAAAEPGIHATTGEYNHYTGHKIDLRSVAEGEKLTNYIKKNFRQIEKRTDGSKQWTNPKTGAIYSLENENGANEHWDVLVTSETFSDALSTNFIQLKELEKISGRESAVIRVNIPKEFWSESFKFTDSIKLEKDVPEIVSTKDGFYEFTLKKVNLEKVAKVSVLPRINYAESEASFSFKIGIDKRDIKMAPEKTKERIEKLNKTIEDFEKVSEVMGKTIKGLKGACLGVGGALHIKNLAQNAQGKGIARQKVMRGDGGWYEICADAVNSGKYSSQEQCLIKESDNIDEDVQAMTKTLAQQQADIQAMQNKYKSDAKFLEEKVIDTSAFAVEYSEQVSPVLTQSLIDEINTGKSSQDKINLEDIKKILTNKDGEGKIKEFEGNNYDVDELREIDLSLRTLNSDASPRMKQSAKDNLYSTLLDIQKNSKGFAEKTDWAKDLEIESSQISTLIVKEAKEIPYTGIINSGRISELDSNVPVQPIQTTTGKQYLIALDDSAGTDILSIKKDVDNGLMVYDNLGKNRISQGEAEELKNIYFKKYDANSYKNPFKKSANHETPVVQYYETEAYKNLPAVVPFDLKNGWYVAARQTLPTLGNIKSYDASGKVNNFYLCNVGPDGIEEFFSGIADDTCQQIFLESGKTYRSFPGLSESEAINLVESAVSAVEQASTARLRNPNLKIGDKIRINTGIGGSINVAVGSPAVEVPNIQCQDFMSPKECNLIFNLCDPVICPSSRCDFGGEYVVKDVIQSGIVGSTLLCLPNAKEKIYAPVCLTGIQAGVDGFTSVEKAYRDCLQKSLDTGETIGICDEIQSVYMCDFFWRQAAPLGKIGISKVIAKAFGQGTRGGGEYLSVANAWESASKSADYFTQSYGINSYNAFKSRSASKQLFAPVCKGFISGAVPKLETLFNAVTEPDSPVQFHARFDEIPYSDVTVPPVSQYKVFYTIYAGKDQPVYYQVYLKPDAEGSLYQDASFIRNVASGFIPVGESATETKDFTAPAGYRKLCINANGYEECGFKEVSTSFAVDYVKDQYAKEQITKTGVSSEKECASGTPSLYNFLTPNIQSSAEGALSPEIYKRGITRLCATNNPGQGTDSSRWIEVGRCSDVGQNVKCWLDQNSMEDALQFAGTKNKTITELEKIWITGLNLSENYEEDFNLEFEEIGKIEGDEGKLRDKISKATSLLEKTFFNTQKAKVFFERGKTYAELAKLVYKNWKDKQVEYLGDEKDGGDKEVPVKFSESDFKFILNSFRISNTDKTFDIILGFDKGKWHPWVYTSSFQYDYQGGAGQPTITGQKAGEFDFVGGKWISLDEAIAKSGDFGLSNEENNTLKSFIKIKDYQEGIDFLETLTIKNKEFILENTNSEMSSNKIFKIKNLESPINNIYFYYKDGDKWYWSYYDNENSPTSGGKFWNAVPVILVKGGPEDPYYSLGTKSKMPLDIQSLVKSLERKKFYDGAFLILTYEPVITEEIPDVSSEEVSLNAIDSYNKYKNLFEKYSKKNKPSKLEEIEFRALLVAVSQWETGIGALKTCGSSGNEDCENWIMGYTKGAEYPSAWKGTEKQIALASSSLKKTFDNPEDAGDEDYKKCKTLSKEAKIKCILSVYNSGLTYEDSKGEFPSGIRTINNKEYVVGWKYAEEVNLLKQGWQNYFNEKILAEKPFSTIEERIIEKAKECSDCGTTGIFGKCKESLCLAIGEKLNRECEFSQIIPEGRGSNCFESQKYLKSLTLNDLTANLVNANNVNNFEWNTQNVEIILRNTINLYLEENGRKYSDNKYFVDQLYKRKFLFENGYKEINGEGLFNAEEDMKYVLSNLAPEAYREIV
ncbi:MAG: hypothetical protein QT10_C0009G0020 [archaeon GW2011_AR19]|nr:MAG: hypothetical protein QT10_C0009G0020 [archaeon GW2011_AR19]